MENLEVPKMILFLIRVLLFFSPPLPVEVNVLYDLWKGCIAVEWYDFINRKYLH